MSLIEKLKFDETERITEDERKYKVPFSLKFIPVENWKAEEKDPQHVCPLPGAFKVVLADRILGERNGNWTGKYHGASVIFGPYELLAAVDMILNPIESIQILNSELTPINGNSEPILVDGSGIRFGEGSSLGLEFKQADSEGYLTRIGIDSVTDQDKVDFDINSVPKIVVRTKRVIRELVNLYESIWEKLGLKESRYYDPESVAELITRYQSKFGEN